jgi:hypothetical protein
MAKMRNLNVDVTMEFPRGPISYDSLAVDQLAVLTHEQR